MSKAILPTLPDDFNEEIIMAKEVHRHGRGSVAKLRLSRVDFEPIAEKEFNGWFGIGNVRTGKETSRETTVSRILQNGGEGEIVLKVKNETVRTVKCKFLKAYSSDDKKYIYIKINHIEG